MTKDEQVLQTTSCLANMIAVVAATATEVAGETMELPEATKVETAQLIGAKLQKKLAPYING